MHVKQRTINIISRHKQSLQIASAERRIAKMYHVALQNE